MQGFQDLQIHVEKHLVGHLDALQHALAQSEERLGSVEIIEQDEVAHHQAAHVPSQHRLLLRIQRLPVTAPPIAHLHAPSVAQRVQRPQREHIAVDELELGVGELALRVLQHGGDVHAHVHCQRG